MNKDNLQVGQIVKYIGPDRMISRKADYKVVRIENTLITIEQLKNKTQIWRVTYREVVLKPT